MLASEGDEDAQDRLNDLINEHHYEICEQLAWTFREVYKESGYTVVNEWMNATPLNSAGGYINFWYHFTDRYWNDLTENGVVMILDHASEG